MKLLLVLFLCLLKGSEWSNFYCYSLCLCYAYAILSFENLTLFYFLFSWKIIIIFDAKIKDLLSRCPVLLLFFFTLISVNAALQVNIHRIPDQPIQLYSGGSVVLTCTVTTNSPNITVAVEWFKSLQSLQHVTNSIHLSPPYRLQEHIWQSSIDLRVLTVQFSGWYYCLATTGDGSSTRAAHYQINVEESGM